MNISFRPIAAIALTSLLTACGAGNQEPQMPMTLGAAVHSELGAAAATGTSAAAAAAATGPAFAASTGPHNPVPDCAAEGCGSLRIIDGNAEAYRIDAMRRAAAEGDSPNRS